MGDALERLRELCLAFPEVTERPSHGEPAWFVREKRTMVTFSDHHHDDRVAFWAAAPPGAQEAYVASDTQRYFRPPYVGGRGWLGVYLDVPADWDEIASIVRAAFLTVAPKRLAARDRDGAGAFTCLRLHPRLVRRRDLRRRAARRARRRGGRGGDVHPAQRRRVKESARAEVVAVWTKLAVLAAVGIAT